MTRISMAAYGKAWSHANEPNVLWNWVGIGPGAVTIDPDLQGIKEDTSGGECV
jgi:hypothetical protein